MTDRITVQLTTPNALWLRQSAIGQQLAINAGLVVLREHDDDDLAFGALSDANREIASERRARRLLEPLRGSRRPPTDPPAWEAGETLPAPDPIIIEQEQGGCEDRDIDIDDPLASQAQGAGGGDTIDPPAVPAMGGGGGPEEPASEEQEYYIEL